MKRILECVPNFSEGRDPKIIEAICAPIKEIDGVRILDVDMGKSTHRTVVTFAGSPEAVIEAAFQAISRAAQWIDMRKHTGAHPRMGATDVCPLIPVSGITVEETLILARQLGDRVGRELGIPVYMYEYAATTPERKNLATIRAGEYEGFNKKIYDPAWKPDYGPTEFNAVSGQTVIGVRDFLVAVNFNLNTTSVRLANSVAFDVRENGRIKTQNGKPNGPPELDANGQPLRIPGMLKACKGVGWFIEEYGFAQVSMNLTQLSVTSLHQAFEAVVKSATQRGLRVTGTEIVGLLPKSTLVDAGRYFLTQQGRSTGVGDAELIRIAIHTLGLSEIRPFHPKEKIIEYCLEDPFGPLASQTVVKFTEGLASDSPAPGGGSVSALCGALAAALTAMVANLSAGKRGWEDQVDYFSSIADKAQQIREELLWLLDEDTRSFDQVMLAFGLPKQTPEEKEIRKKAIEEATIYAAEIPLRVMEAAFACLPLVLEMTEKGNPNSISDAGVGGLCAWACLSGAAYNVQINLKDMKDHPQTPELMGRCKTLLTSGKEMATKIENLMHKHLGE
jgi:glutamate formiminotransferase/formiminotetrahydrofolate cyclodeaminase